MPVRRQLLVLALVAAAGSALLLASAEAARPRVRLTATPPTVTAETTATFHWRAARGTRRTLCRLGRRAVAGTTSTQAVPARKLIRRVVRCSSPAKWTGLAPGRYRFTLIAESARGTTRL